MLITHTLWEVAYRCSGMRTKRGPRGQFSSLYGTTTLRLRPEFAYPPGGPRYERLVFDANDQLIVPLNEWYPFGQIFSEPVGQIRSEATTPLWVTSVSTQLAGHRAPPSVGTVMRQPPRLWSDPLLTHHAAVQLRHPFANSDSGTLDSTLALFRRRRRPLRRAGRPHVGGNWPDHQHGPGVVDSASG